ncbi:MAG: nitronate monooxygenase [Spirochaetia bacterium]|nr:nitronate monooxygenase [Spirochaetia bacterium]
MFQTAVTKMLNIKLPIIGAPMFLVSYPELVAAVSEAGGLGTFPTMNYRSIPELKDALFKIKSKTQKPIGVNIVLYKEHNPNWSEQLKVCLDNKVNCIITSMGIPRSVIKEAKSAGAKVFCDVIDIKYAKLTAKAGADALIAVSAGAGGHAGKISPFSLIPYLKDEINIPVIAAGSISSGRQMAAAMALGAEAVYIGTRFIASCESGASEEYKQAIIKAMPEDIIYSKEISGVYANWLKESFDKYKNIETTDLKKWKDIWSAGHGVGQIKNILSVKKIMDDIIQEYKDVTQKMKME